MKNLVIFERYLLSIEDQIQLLQYEQIYFPYLLLFPNANLNHTAFRK